VNLPKILDHPLIQKENIIAHYETFPLAHARIHSRAGAANWLRYMASLNVQAPLCIAWDLGACLTVQDKDSFIQKPGYIPEDIDTSEYVNFLKKIDRQSILKELRQWHLSDPIVGLILSKLLDGIHFPEKYQIASGIPSIYFSRALAKALETSDPGNVFKETNPDTRPHLNDILPSEFMAQIRSNLHRLDLNELKFIHQYGARHLFSPNPQDMLDLFNLTSLPKAVRMAISQMMRMIPSVSQVQKTASVQTYAMGGYEGLTRKGSIDSLVPTELAYSQDMFYHRLFNREAMYYGREGAKERQRELIYIVTQTGNKMSGDSTIMAQALTLALSKTMKERGYEVLQSFAGSILTKPEPMERSSDIHRVLYFQDDHYLNEKKVIHTAIKQLKQWKDTYRTIQVFWIVSAYWDLDGWNDHIKQYLELRQLAGNQGWIMKHSQDCENKFTTRMFHKVHEIVCDEILGGDSQLVWNDGINIETDDKEKDIDELLSNVDWSKYSPGVQT